MLIDLLADGLPNARKRRWHFNTFMLYAFSQLERFRRASPATASPDNEYSLLWLAKQLVEESPILFLDEFQLPDRAASKILSHLFIAFFQLGGVLVASSNRVPEELQKAIGVDYAAPPRGGFVRSSLVASRRRGVAICLARRATLLRSWRFLRRAVTFGTWMVLPTGGGAMSSSLRARLACRWKLRPSNQRCCRGGGGRDICGDRR